MEKSVTSDGDAHLHWSRDYDLATKWSLLNPFAAFKQFVAYTANECNLDDTRLRNMCVRDKCPLARFHGLG
ncbi:unnamed protein product [Dovyalis caffra]|uniref:Uncharacterized protein n=1 Tax=Dovyalis caffra TaxID=77055 RepID=A0AAV1R9N3_9ROSI|nr:unnamed protein product [Dovyalis caffra]